jgi:hypothetical protein
MDPAHGAFTILVGAACAGHATHTKKYGWAVFFVIITGAYVAFKCAGI